MKIKTILAAVIAGLALGPSMAWGQCATWTTSTIRNCNGLDYELWNQNNKGTVSMQITGGSTNPNGGRFSGTWNGTENILIRAGKKWGASSTTTAKSVGNISLEFAATWTSGDNVKMLGIYGWAYYPSGSNPTKTENGQNTSFSNQIEYYIIQDRGSYNAASGGTNSKKYGEGTIDGIVYEFYVADRLNQPMLTGNGNFKQYFSVPKSTASHRQSGTVSVSKHFEAWDKAGMKMLDCPLYEVAMKVESYTGSATGKGSANVTKNLLTLGGSVTPNQYALTTNVSPIGGGTVTKSPNSATYALNASVQLTATPAAGYKFVGWSGNATGTTSPTTITMSADRTVTALFELVSGDGTANLLKDGNFPSSAVIADDGASWKLGQGTNWGNSAASSTVAGGTATINVTTIGAETYQPQLVQYGLALDKGMKYKLTFKARAASARKIEASFQQSVDPWAGYASKEFDLTTVDQDFEYVFEMTADSDPEAQFAFNLGQATGNVYLSNIKLVHTTASTVSVSRDLFAPKSGAAFVFVRGRTLNVTPVGTSAVQVRVVDTQGKVRAIFPATASATFSMSELSAGRYFVDVRGAGVRQVTPIVLD
jgi:uncharacterized repeat protein (TIGR02543 family)